MGDKPIVNRSEQENDPMLNSGNLGIYNAQDFPSQTKDLTVHIYWCFTYGRTPASEGLDLVIQSVYT
jgi:hypothetical protein